MVFEVLVTVVDNDTHSTEAAFNEPSIGSSCMKDAPDMWYLGTSSSKLRTLLRGRASFSYALAVRGIAATSGNGTDNGLELGVELARAGGVGSLGSIFNVLNMARS